MLRFVMYMSKYVTHLKIILSHIAIYRSQAIWNVVFVFSTPLITAFIFANLNQQSGNILPFNPLTYYISITLIYFLSNSQIDTHIQELGSTGDISFLLLRPINVYRWLFAQEVFQKISYIVSVLPLLVVCAVIVLISNYQLHFSTIIGVGILTVLAYGICFNISYIVGLFIFWIDDAWGLTNVRHVTTALCGGLLIPYALFPDKLLQIVKLTPFPYIAYIPSHFSQDPKSIYIGISCLWFVATYVMCRFWSKMSLNKYSTVA